jgi:hypothetical protein
VHRVFGFAEARERSHLEDLGVRGKNIKKDFRNVGWGGEDWIRLAQYRNRWRGHM